jgi:hypothetical protein
MASSGTSLLTAQALSSNTIRLTFSAPVSLSQTEALTAFRISDSAGNPLEVRFIRPSGKNVLLITVPMPGGTLFTVTSTLAGANQTADFVAVIPSPPSDSPPGADPHQPINHRAASIPHALPTSGIGIVMVLTASGATVGWMQSRKRKRNS